MVSKSPSIFKVEKIQSGVAELFCEQSTSIKAPFKEKSDKKLEYRIKLSGGIGGQFQFKLFEGNSLKVPYSDAWTVMTWGKAGAQQAHNSK